MSIGSSLVARVLRSPVHGLLSGSLDLVRYTGRTSGREITTPTMYARRGDDVVILVGRPETKTWWRNFASDRDVDVLLQGRWMAMTARAIVGAEEPDTIAPLLDAYLQRFPRVVRSLGEGPPTDRARRAVIVWCRVPGTPTPPRASRDSNARPEQGGRSEPPGQSGSARPGSDRE